jgi:hypothetical protein
MALDTMQLRDEATAARERLVRTVATIEDDVRRVTSWRTSFDKDPRVLLAAALGAGVLAGVLTASRGRGRGVSSQGRSALAPIGGVLNDVWQEVRTVAVPLLAGRAVAMVHNAFGEERATKERAETTRAANRRS